MKGYIGKTELTLFDWTKEHGWKDKESAIYKTFDQWSAWKKFIDFFRIEGVEVDLMQFNVNAVRKNIKIIQDLNTGLDLSKILLYSDHLTSDIK